MWDDHYYADQTVTWTGGCSGGLASGTGTLKWIRGSEANEHSGLLQDGKHTGDWVLLRWADGRVQEGPYVDGNKHGRWVLRFADGESRKGPMWTATSTAAGSCASRTGSPGRALRGRQQARPLGRALGGRERV